MKCLPLLLFFCLLVALTQADATTQTYLDIPACLLPVNAPLLVRVQRRVEIDYAFNLLGTGQWTQYPDMHVIIDLAFSQFVKIFYNIQIAINSNQGWINTRVMIDGVQNRILRRGMAHLKYPSVYMDTEVFLQKGRRTIKLEYMTNCNRVQKPDWDWASNIFQVSYYKAIN